MDTNQKNREAARQRRPKQSPQKRAAERSTTGTRRSTSQKNTAAAKRPAQQTAQRQRAPQQKAAQQRSLEQRKAERPAQQRPVQRSSAHADDGIKRSAPQGAHLQRSSRQSTAAPKKPVQQPVSAQKRTVKQNSLQNFISGIKNGTPEKSESRAAQAEARRKERAAKAEKRRKQAARNDAPAVIYTQPAAFNRNRLLVQLLTVTAVVVALVMGLSVFFKVGTITVSGAEVYSAWAVREASGIEEGDSLLTFSRQRAMAQIQAKLPYVEKSRIGIKLPETVIIYIEEMDVAYAIKSSDGVWWLMNSTGRMVEQIDAAAAAGYTQVLGVTVESPKSNEDAVATEDIPTETDESGEFIPVTVTGAQRLNSALQILQALEANDIVGEAASVDVSRLEDIILWYGTRYQVNLGDTSRMEYKINYMNDAILQMSDYQAGVLDVSFTTWPDQAGYTPFE